jgi:ribonuclease D
LFLIEKEEELEVFLRSVNGEMESAPESERFMAVDTEFIREHLDQPLLCLIQIAVPGRIFIIDPLAVDVFPLRTIFSDPNFRKVFHSAAQDLEILELSGIDVVNIYDTQLHESIVSVDYCLGYQSMVWKYLNKKIEKNHRMSDWRKRPLSETQLQYSAADVFYLRSIYKLQFQKLIQLQRENWLVDELYSEKEKAAKKFKVKKKPNNQRNIMNLLKILLDVRSRDYQIAAPTISTSKDLEKLADGRHDAKCLSGWRSEVFGKDALRLLEGKISLRIAGTDVTIDTNALPDIP